MPALSRVVFLYLFFALYCPLNMLGNSVQYNADLWDTLTIDGIKKNPSHAELASIFNQVDFYDFVRSNNQKEEIINYLLLQCQKQRYTIGIAKCSNILGVIARDRSEYAKAIELHETALNLSGSDTVTTIYSLNNLGVVYRRLDKPRLALDFHMKALELAEKYNGDHGIKIRSISVALNSIGNINLTLNQPHKALEVFKQSLKIELENENNLGIAINYQNMGYSFEAMGKIDTALAYYKRSLQVNEKINSIVGLSICNNSIGNIYLLQNEPYLAIDCFQKALALSETTNDYYYISQGHANIGRVYLMLNQLPEAYVQLQRFNELAVKINSGMLIKESHELLSQYYEKKSEFDKALSHFRVANQVNDSIVNEQNTRYLNELQTIYEAHKKEQHIGLLTAENRIKKQQVIITLIAFSMLVLLIFFLIYFQQKKAFMQKCDLENKLFRSQMNPHFIFNALGSIQSFMYQNESQKAAQYLGLYSTLTRSVLNCSNNELITLEEEINTLKNYIEIEKMRMGDSFSYHIFIDEDVETDFTHVPPLMLQPFVENAIHHGLKNLSDRKGNLVINVTQMEEHIRVEIIDNGPGINHTRKENRSDSHESMGIKIFKQRMDLIKKKYKKTINFAATDLSEIDPGQTGTIITIEFPLIYPND